MSILLACMSVHPVCALCPLSSKDLWTCKPPHGCWVQNLSSLQEQQTLLTTEPSLQPLIPFLKDLPLSTFSDYAKWGQD